MSEAQKEAARRWPADGDLPDMLYPRVAVRENMRGAFVAGAEYERTREVTDAEIEAGVKSVFERMSKPRLEASVEFEASVRHEVIGILKAAREVQA